MRVEIQPGHVCAAHVQPPRDPVPYYTIWIAGGHALNLCAPCAKDLLEVLDALEHGRTDVENAELRAEREAARRKGHP